MDLSTTYLGLTLAHPFMAGASPLADQLDVVRRLEDGGAAAVVLRSLFEEQITFQARGEIRHRDPHEAEFAAALAHFPEPDAYEGFPMHEDGVGMARTLELELFGRKATATGVEAGFFAWADAGPAPAGAADAAASTGTDYEPYRGTRAAAGQLLQIRPSRSAPVGILTGAFGAKVLSPLVAQLERDDIRVLPVENRYFGGTTSVTA